MENEEWRMWKRNQAGAWPGPTLDSSFLILDSPFRLSPFGSGVNFAAIPPGATCTFASPSLTTSSQLLSPSTQLHYLTLAECNRKASQRAISPCDAMGN